MTFFSLVCAIYGSDANCLVDKNSFVDKFFANLTKAPFLCMCQNDNSGKLND